MKEQIIKAISFFYQGERHVITAGKTGKFRVPVTEAVSYTHLTLPTILRV